MDAPLPPAAPVVLFDGTCTFCNGAVQFLVDHEKRPELRFAPLQSEPGRALLERAVGPDEAARLAAGARGEGDPDTMIVLEDGHVYTHSTAGLRLARRLRAPYSFLVVLLVVPRFLRDAVYRWFARNRYRWFGKEETCRVPTPELRERFLA